MEQSPRFQPVEDILSDLPPRPSTPAPAKTPAADPSLPLHRRTFSSQRDNDELMASLLSRCRSLQSNPLRLRAESRGLLQCMPTLEYEVTKTLNPPVLSRKKTRTLRFTPKGIENVRTFKDQLSSFYTWEEVVRVCLTSLTSFKIFYRHSSHPYLYSSPISLAIVQEINSRKSLSNLKKRTFPKPLSPRRMNGRGGGASDGEDLQDSESRYSFSGSEEVSWDEELRANRRLMMEGIGGGEVDASVEQISKIAKTLTKPALSAKQVATRADPLLVERNVDSYMRTRTRTKSSLCASEADNAASSESTTLPESYSVTLSPTSTSSASPVPSPPPPLDSSHSPSPSPSPLPPSTLSPSLSPPGPLSQSDSGEETFSMDSYNDTEFDVVIERITRNLMMDTKSTEGITLNRFMMSFQEAQKNPLTLTMYVRSFLDAMVEHLFDTLKSRFIFEDLNASNPPMPGPSLRETLLSSEEDVEGEAEIEVGEVEQRRSLRLRDAIEHALETLLMSTLNPKLWVVIHKQHSAGDESFRKNRVTFSQKSQAFFGIRFPSPSAWHHAVCWLDQVEDESLPWAKAECIVNMFKSIFLLFEKEQIDASPGAKPNKDGELMVLSGDDILPIVIFVVSRSKVRRMLSFLAYQWELILPDYQTGQVGYYLTVLSSAVEYIKLTSTPQ